MKKHVVLGVCAIALSLTSAAAAAETPLTGGKSARSVNGEYEAAACNASLQVFTPLGLYIDIQFLTKNLWTPLP